METSSAAAVERLDRSWARRLLWLSLLLLPLAAAGCQTASHSQITALERDGSDLRIVLMPLDVELSELTVSGMLELNAEWTEAAHEHMVPALQQETASRRATIIEYDPARADPEASRLETQIIKLHAAVGNSILLHQYVPAFALPTKKDKFDWSLGPAVGRLRRGYDADYALFVFVRDSYSSPGRAALILAGAVFGVGIPGGTQIGFASLVDLDTGQIVWFNRLARGAGDLRQAEPARETVRQLLAGLPE